MEADDLVTLSELGRGAYGVVEKVRHAQSGTIMAVKVSRALAGQGALGWGTPGGGLQEMWGLSRSMVALSQCLPPDGWVFTVQNFPK